MSKENEYTNGNGDKIVVKMPLEEWVINIVEHTIREAQKTCPILQQVAGNTERIDKLRIRWATLIGFMIGSGMISGGAVFGAMRLLGG